METQRTQRSFMAITRTLRITIQMATSIPIMATTLIMATLLITATTLTWRTWCSLVAITRIQRFTTQMATSIPTMATTLIRATPLIMSITLTWRTWCSKAIPQTQLGTTQMATSIPIMATILIMATPHIMATSLTRRTQRSFMATPLTQLMLGMMHILSMRLKDSTRLHFSLWRQALRQYLKTEMIKWNSTSWKWPRQQKVWNNISKKRAIPSMAELSSKLIWLKCVNIHKACGIPSSNLFSSSLALPILLPARSSGLARLMIL